MACFFLQIFWARECTIVFSSSKVNLTSFKNEQPLVGRYTSTGSCNQRTMEGGKCHLIPLNCGFRLPCDFFVTCTWKVFSGRLLLYIVRLKFVSNTALWFLRYRASPAVTSVLLIFFASCKQVSEISKEASQVGLTMSALFLGRKNRRRWIWWNL